jgi:hypothetical protein
MKWGCAVVLTPVSLVVIFDDTITQAIAPSAVSIFQPF